MTDIDTMPAGPEMDRLIAEKVMGWRLLNYETDEPAIDHLSSDGCAWRDAQGRDGFDGEAWEWAPSTNIAHAWEVVDWLTHKHFSLYWCDSQCEWLARFDPRMCVEQDARHKAWGEEPALAICRAALKAVQA